MEAGIRYTNISAADPTGDSKKARPKYFFGKYWMLLATYTARTSSTGISSLRIFCSTKP
jgi:hypothetical protein